MLFVQFDTNEEQSYSSTEEAEQAIQDVICNGEAESAELLQGDEVVAEYSKDEFDC